MAESSPSKKKKLKQPSILVMGVGGSGTKAVAELAAQFPSINAIGVDTDSKALETSGIKKTIQIGVAVTNGFSAGGDVELGRQSVEKDSSNIRELLRQADLLVIATGLGGGTGSGAVPVISRIAREANTMVLCMLTTPFAFEGNNISAKAQEAVKRIRMHADAVVKIPNEMLIDRKEKELPAEEAMARGQKVISDGIPALWRMILQPGVCSLDFASIQTMLRNCDGFCHLVSMEASGEARSANIAKGIVTHQLLNDGKVLKNAAGVIVGLTGGSDLKLSEVQNVISAIQKKLPNEDVWFNFGIVNDDACNGKLSTMVLVAEQWKEPLMADERRQLGFSFSQGEQGRLPLETTGKGQFDKVDPTIHGNQDLDVPTYIRKNIKLPR